MRTTVYRYSITMIVLLLCQFVHAQTPNWSVNAKDFQFSMNYTGVFVTNCSFVNNTNNKIAAFVGDELRGVANFSVENNGQALAFLTVYSNMVSGEEVRFEVFNATLEQIMSLPIKRMFTENAFEGNMQQPFQFYADTTITTDIELKKENNTYTLQAHISCANDATFTYQFVNGTGSTDNHLLTITGNQLVRHDSATQNVYNIRVKATSNTGMSFEKSLVVNYSNSGIKDYVLNISNCIYPNPLTGNILTIVVPNEEVTEVKVVDAKGKRIKIQNMHQLTEMELNLTPGIYIVEIHTASHHVLYQKLIKP
jgi:hypothetical protein